MPQGSPWAARTAGNCNQLNSTQTPNTGVTRKYDFTVTDALLAPDGKQKNMIVVNGQYPGPLIEVILIVQLFSAAFANSHLGKLG
jgi:hypothetical protein